MTVQQLLVALDRQRSPSMVDAAATEIQAWSIREKATERATQYRFHPARPPTGQGKTIATTQGMGAIDSARTTSLSHAVSPLHPARYRR